MLTLVPAGRTIIDRRREARGRLTEPRLISNPLPGVERAAEVLGRGLTPMAGALHRHCVGSDRWPGFRGHGAQVRI